MSRYRVSCAGEDVVGIVKGGYFTDLDEAIAAADYAGACVTDLTDDSDHSPQSDDELKAARERIRARA
jgi:hypothetical protein